MHVVTIALIVISFVAYSGEIATSITPSQTDRATPTKTLAHQGELRIQSVAPRARTVAARFTTTSDGDQFALTGVARTRRHGASRTAVGQSASPAAARTSHRAQFAKHRSPVAADRRETTRPRRTIATDHHKTADDRTPAAPERSTRPTDRGSTTTDRTPATADRTPTAADRATTAPDRTTTAPDQAATAADRATTAPDRRKPPPDRTNTAPDRTKTAPDRTKTAPDRTKPAPDRTNTASYRVTHDVSVRSPSPASYLKSPVVGALRFSEGGELQGETERRRETSEVGYRACVQWIGRMLDTHPLESFSLFTCRRSPA